MKTRYTIIITTLVNELIGSLETSQEISQNTLETIITQRTPVAVSSIATNVRMIIYSTQDLMRSLIVLAF